MHTVRVGIQARGTPAQFNNGVSVPIDTTNWAGHGKKICVRQIDRVNFMNNTPEFMQVSSNFINAQSASLSACNQIGNLHLSDSGAIRDTMNPGGASLGTTNFHDAGYLHLDLVSPHATVHERRTLFSMDSNPEMDSQIREYGNVTKQSLRASVAPFNEKYSFIDKDGLLSKMISRNSETTTLKTMSQPDLMGKVTCPNRVIDDMIDAFDENVSSLPLTDMNNMKIRFKVDPGMAEWGQYSEKVHVGGLFMINYVVP